MSSHKQVVVLQIAPIGDRSDQRRTYSSKRALRYLFRFPQLIKLAYWLLRLRGYVPATVQSAMQADRGRFVCLAVDDDHLDDLTRVASWLKRKRIGVTLLLRGKELRKKAFRLRAKDYAAMGWEIASASFSRADLTEMTSQGQELEITRSRREIQRHLGISPQGFAYPFGAYDASSVYFVRNEGFAYALTQTEGINELGQDPFQIRTVCLSLGLSRLFPLLLQATRQKPAPLESSERLPAPALKSGVNH